MLGNAITNEAQGEREALVKRRTASKRGSAGEMALEAQLGSAAIPFEREVRFNPGRRWRLDFVVGWSTLGDRLAVEIQGGLWSGGRHVRARAMEAEMEKWAEATIAGYHILVVSTDQAKDGTALRWVKRALRL